MTRSEVVGEVLEELAVVTQDIVCPCVQDWVRHAPGAVPQRELIEEQEGGLYIHYLIWESTGSPTALYQADRLRTGVLTAWIAAKRVFAWRKEEHTCGRDATR